MITQKDLQAAVAANLLNEAQASRLAAFAHSRAGARENLKAGDEPFELFRGFNEIFIVVGLIILGTGWTGVSMAMLWTQEGYGLQTAAAIAAFISAGVVWALSEYFVIRRRMVAPAIFLAIMFGTSVLQGFSFALAEAFMLFRGDVSSIRLPFGLGLIAMFVYWLRFRVPFAMAMLAVGAYMFALLLSMGADNPMNILTDLFVLGAQGYAAWITLGVGLAVFALAMFFDCSDPYRVTRRSAQGFWLHIVAAPMLVNTAAVTLLDQDSSGAYTLLFLAILGFALVAIVIDRRSFLITAIGYLIVLMAIVFETGNTWEWGVLGLGVLLLVLGSFWVSIRAALLGRVFFWLPLDRLPPAFDADAS